MSDLSFKFALRKELFQPRPTYIPPNFPTEWGNQSLIRPIPNSALTIRASDRLCCLAKPRYREQSDALRRKPLYQYSCGCPSVLIVIPNAALTANCSAKIVELANPKRRTSDNIQIRSSREMLHVKKNIKPLSDKIKQLSRSKYEYQLKEWQIFQKKKSFEKRSYFLSERIRELALPKSKQRVTLEDKPQISRKAINYEPSLNILELSKPKPISLRNLIREPYIKKSALNYTPSGKIIELSKPIQKADNLHLIYDITKFQVKKPALKAICSDRIWDLAEPRSYSSYVEPLKINKLGEVKPTALKQPHPKTSKKLFRFSKSVIKQ
ncbi:testicular haploid expressed gene protein-like isoform X1 [Centruroides sculpturatus]|uniref:testicular haploid expressed gene protein-like isoform X1 n=1 Tax=Centruroides sculpturatus TaxID=218467 RepID=UPI000C6DD1F5|nr:testicular haploid expressed gene protein-like isoform X1 [Centruroides sculpturatus]XP_023216283.1 testicular haploid expressed gene protein-like isoform X1 [Centruroides sculpturatus]